MLDEILVDLKKLSRMGPIKSLGDGSNNSIGKTFRNVLNIKSQRNEYKGFRINATSSKSNSRNTLIPGCVPDWQKSIVKSPKDIVDQYGISDISGKYQKKLFCTVDSLRPNNFGLILKVDTKNNLLSEYFQNQSSKKQIAIWDSNRLNKYLQKKNNIIIVSANKKLKKDGVYFHFCFAEVFMNLTFKNFLKFISYGSINMDHSISLKHGSNSAKEQGPSFKISKEACAHLYRDYRKYDLMDK